MGQADADYLLCLLVFSVSVVAYTAWGGFRAVVWTDVMQGVIMGVGVVIMLVLVLSQLGGLGKATQEIARQTPPLRGEASLQLVSAASTEVILKKGTWIELASEHNATHKVHLRTASRAIVESGQSGAELSESKPKGDPAHIPVILVRTPVKNVIELKSIRRDLAAQTTPPLQVAIQGKLKSYASGADKPGVLPVSN